MSSRPGLSAADLYTADLRNEDKLAEALTRAYSYLIPAPEKLPHKWCEENIIVPDDGAKSGRIRFSNAPYQIEPLDSIIDRTCTQVTLCFGAQDGKTMIVNCGILYDIGHEPESQMFMQPSETDMQAWLNTKFQPMVDNCKVVENIIAAPRSRGNVNNQKMKTYAGRFLLLCWAGSLKMTRGRSAPKIKCDEIDAYDDPGQVAKIWKRADTFGTRRQLTLTSTPIGSKITSLIWRHFKAGDQRYWNVRCPDKACNHQQVLEWSQVEWLRSEEGEHMPQTAKYLCKGCGSLWNDVQRKKAIRNGEWIATKPYRGHKSYHLNTIASCFVKLSDLVVEYLSARGAGNLATFYNDTLALPFEEKGKKASWKKLQKRQENYKADVHRDALLITAGVDTQPDRFEVTVYAWGLPEEDRIKIKDTNKKRRKHNMLGIHQVPRGWAIDTQIIKGSPSDATTRAALLDYLQTPFNHELGFKMRISATAIDSGGHNTADVYKFCRQHKQLNVFAIKGGKVANSPLVARPTKVGIPEVDLYTVGTQTSKGNLLTLLKIAKPSAGYIHYPKNKPGFDKEFFKQLASDKLVTSHKNGEVIKTYTKVSTAYKKGRRRNEQADILRYAIVAREILNPRYNVLRKLVKGQIPDEEVKDDTPGTVEDKKVEKPPKRTVKKKVAKRRSKKRSFVKGYK